MATNANIESISPAGIKLRTQAHVSLSTPFVPTQSTAAVMYRIHRFPVAPAAQALFKVDMRPTPKSASQYGKIPWYKRLAFFFGPRKSSTNTPKSYDDNNHNKAGSKKEEVGNDHEDTGAAPISSAEHNDGTNTLAAATQADHDLPKPQNPSADTALDSASSRTSSADTGSSIAHFDDDLAEPRVTLTLDSTADVVDAMTGKPSDPRFAKLSPDVQVDEDELEMLITDELAPELPTTPTDVVNADNDDSSSTDEPSFPSSDDGKGRSHKSSTDFMAEEYDSIELLVGPVSDHGGNTIHNTPTKTEEVESAKASNMGIETCNIPRGSTMTLPQRATKKSPDATYHSLVPNNPPGWTGPSMSAEDFIFGRGNRRSRRRRLQALQPNPYDTTGTRATWAAAIAKLRKRPVASSPTPESKDKVAVQNVAEAAVEPKSVVELESLASHEDLDDAQAAAAKDAASAVSASELQAILPHDVEVATAEVSAGADQHPPPVSAEVHDDHQTELADFNDENYHADRESNSKSTSTSESTSNSDAVSVSTSNSDPTTTSEPAEQDDLDTADRPKVIDWDTLLLKATSGTPVHWSMWVLAYVSKHEHPDRLKLATNALAGLISHDEMFMKLRGTNTYAYRHCLPTDIVELDGRKEPWDVSTFPDDDENTVATRPYYISWLLQGRL
ncbi:hypothetical protein K490DRAFT_64827 [Saccharata proteae CBS 121410]|uniref:Uncharacterized protein n=1 Tax=Saccharata proteae CBS 121410 TaxID=1314787 RepID=A0A9P4LW50_9PEZI|nr:hypothetical protein K490DRAFT_64827 [Saccharata proteae CBS 121410]